MQKTIITKEFLAKEYKHTGACCLFGIFMIAGIGVMLIPVFQPPEGLTNLLCTIAFTSIFGGLIFGYFFGLRNILNIKKDCNSLLKGNFEIYIDELSEKDTYSRSDESTRYLLGFKEYSFLSNSSISVERSVYNKAIIGEKFYLIRRNHEKKVYIAYPQSQFELSPELYSMIKPVRSYFKDEHYNEDY